jgi:acetyl-CoA carboxylase carboxyltransferase component
MDSRGLGNDACFAWPSAEIAVMGAKGAVQILHRTIGDAERVERECDYAARYCTPAVAAERGLVDDVIDPVNTRRAVAFALRALLAKREHLPRRRHSNGPL